MNIDFASILSMMPGFLAHHSDAQISVYVLTSHLLLDREIKVEPFDLQRMGISREFVIVIQRDGETFAHVSPHLGKQLEKHSQTLQIDDKNIEYKVLEEKDYSNIVSSITDLAQSLLNTNIQKDSASVQKTTPTFKTKSNHIAVKPDVSLQKIKEDTRRSEANIKKQIQLNIEEEHKKQKIEKKEEEKRQTLKENILRDEILKEEIRKEAIQEDVLNKEVVKQQQPPKRVSNYNKHIGKSQ